MDLKIFFVSIALLLAAPTFQTFASSENADPVTIPVVEVPTPDTPDPGTTEGNDDDDEHQKGDTSKWRRIPARPANCTISIDRVYIDGEAVAIESFEVRDAEGNIVAIFSDEKAFISFIFSAEGEFELIFHLPSRTLHGFISI